MAADPEYLRFFVDESLLGLGKALSFARRDVVHSGHGLVTDAPTGASDEQWIPAVAARGLVVIGRDKHLRTRPAEIALWKEHGLRVFEIAGKRDLQTWDYLSRLVRRWDDIEARLEHRGSTPWCFRVFDRSLKEVDLA